MRRLFQWWSEKVAARHRRRRVPLRPRSSPSRTFEGLEPRRLLTGVDGTVFFNEIMYHPTGNNFDLEWIELYNHNAIDVDISNWSIRGGVSATIPNGTIFQAGQYLVIASNPTVLAAATGLSGILGPFTGHLSNSGEKIDLYNNADRIIDEVSYSNTGKWPLAADGSGASMAKRVPDSDSQDPASWVSSIQVGGTPGLRNFSDPNTPATVTQPISSGTAWKYEASGTNLGTSWRSPGYSDSGWGWSAGSLRAAR